MAIAKTKEEAQATLRAIEEAAKTRELNAGDLANRDRAQAQLRSFQQEEANVLKQKTRLQEGVKLGQELVGAGSLGRAKTGTDLERIDTDAVRQGRSAEVAEIIARRREALSGMSGAESQAQRDIAANQIGRQTETTRRQLQAIQARTGVRGGTASQQQLQAILEGQRSRSEFERDLFLQNEQIKREALNRFESSVTSAEASEAQRQLSRAELLKFNIDQQARERQLEAEQERFNLQQAAREQAAQLGVGTAFAGLLAGQEASERAAAAQQAAAAARPSGGK